MSEITLDTGVAIGEAGTLRRSIDWKGAFWVASGVPALVLFSIGGISGMVGNLAFLIWTASMLMGFVQSFTYAEIAWPVSEQIRRRIGLRRCRLGSLQQIHCPPIRLVQLAGLVTRALARLLYRRGLCAERPGAHSRRHLPGSHAVDRAARRRHHRRADSTGRRGSRRPHPCHSQLVAVLSLAGPGRLFAERNLLHRRGHHAGRVRHSAPRHSWHCQCTKICWSAGDHPDADRRCDSLV